MRIYPTRHENTAFVLQTRLVFSWLMRWNLKAVKKFINSLWFVVYLLPVRLYLLHMYACFLRFHIVFKMLALMLSNYGVTAHLCVIFLFVTKSYSKLYESLTSVSSKNFLEQVKMTKTRLIWLAQKLQLQRPHCGFTVGGLCCYFLVNNKNPLYNLQQPHCSASKWQFTASKSRHRGLEEIQNYSLKCVKLPSFSIFYFRLGNVW